jgi:hypothetical protein
MKPWDKVSSLRGANILFQGQQYKGRSDRRENTRRSKREHRAKKEHTEEIQKTDHKRQINSSRSKKGPTQITEGEITGDPRSRAEEPGPLRDTTSEGHNTL